MEIFSFRRFLAISPIIIVFIACTICASCSSSEFDEPDFINADKVGQSNGKMKSIKLSDGETIVVKDTVYEFNPSDITNRIAISYSKKYMLATLAPKAILRAYGYDSKVAESDWKQMVFSREQCEQYGLPNHTTYYITRYYIVHKNLSKEKDTDVMPASYTQEGAPANAMGWTPGTSNAYIGFTAVPKSDYIADGMTRVLLIRSDISGIVYNKTVPAEPDNLIWAYKTVDNSDIW